MHKDVKCTKVSPQHYTKQTVPKALSQLYASCAILINTKKEKKQHMTQN